MANYFPWKFRLKLFNKAMLNKGQAAEQQAADYLKDQGLNFIEKNYL